MKKIIISLVTLILLYLNSSANTLLIDSVKTDTAKLHTTTLKTTKDDILVIRHFDEFLDIINTDISGSTDFYDWITDDIHQRKFDFSKVKDTLPIILNDTNDFYTHPVKGNVTSEFGRRKWRYHYGTDINLNTGDTVVSAFNGKVRISTYSKSYGNVIVIRHKNGLETIYGHLSKRLVDVDSTISSGTVIGLGGNTGRSYGSHLHFEVRYFDEALDPRDIIAFEDFTTHYDTLNISKCNFAYRKELKMLSEIKYHSVKNGNTLGHIARKYGTSINTICRLNGISRNKILQIGEKLRVR
ncbi:MAG: peptidoglycan DD-metalloendopeptidase family protein [Flavobacteriales bacterium]